ncbi:MAG: DNA alkylation repair protein [Planctomycetes bacterium]|nr:DNA alkylation repair protein [Planctomycetota bacterium]
MKSKGTLEEILAKLEKLGDPKVRAHNAKWGVGKKQFGVKLGDLRKLAAKLGVDPELAGALWKTGNFDARMLAVLLLDPKRLTRKQLDALVRSADAAQLADWLNAYVVRQHADKEALRQEWMEDDDPWAARAGWSLTSERIGKSPEGLDLQKLLKRIESEMGKAPAPTQWTMNFCLAGIGIHFPEHRKRAIAIGEKLGIYRDYPTSKGCTSPFAPIWIEAMVRKKG